MERLAGEGSRGWLPNNLEVAGDGFRRQLSKGYRK